MHAREGVGVNVAFDVALAFVLQYLVDGNEDAGLFDLAEVFVDGGAEHAHRGRKIHVGIDERRDVEAALAHRLVEHFVVGAEVVFHKEAAEFVFGHFGEDGMHSSDQSVAVAEVSFEEVQYHVARLSVEGGIHGHLPKEVFQAGDDDGERTQSVPKVVEGVEALSQIARTLVFEGDERAPEFDGLRKKVFDEVVGKLKHVARGQTWLPIVLEADVARGEETIASQDFFGIGIPDDELIVGVLAGVELIEVERKSCASPGSAEGDFAQAPDFAHHVGGVVMGDDVNLVAGLVGLAQFEFGSEFGFEQSPTDGSDDFLHKA